MYVIRKSVFEAYVRCPRMAWYMLNDPRSDEEHEHSQASAIGSRFHEFAFKFFEHPWTIPGEFRGIEREMAERFVRFEMRRYKHLEREGRIHEWVPLEREVYLRDEDVWGIEGHIDRVDWYDAEKKQVSIVEYKTTSRLDETKIRRELSFYVLLWRQVRPEEVVQICCYNPRIDEVFVEDVKEKSVRNVERWLGKIRASELSGEWPRKFNEVGCYFCEYNERCLDVD